MPRARLRKPAFCQQLQALFTPAGLLFTLAMPSSEVAPVQSAAKNNWQFALLLVLTAVILFQAPLRKSLWLDETVSVWVTQGTLSDTIHRSLNYQSTSPLYFVILWFVRQTLGQSELALRLFSVLAIAAAGGFLYAIAKRIAGFQAAILSLAFFVSQDAIQKLAFSARPYAAAILCALWSVYALLRWMENGERAFQAQYLLATLLTIYFQYLYAPLIFIHIAFVSLHAPCDRTKLRYFFFRLLPLLALLLLPAFFQLSHLAQKSLSLKFMMERSIGDFALALLPLNVVAYLLIALVFAIVYDVYRWRPFSAAEIRIAIILAVWAILPAAWLYAYSGFSAGSVFVDRYYAWAAPGSALFLALVISHIGPARALRNILLVFILMAFFREVQHQWNFEDWKGAVRKADAAASAQVPILAYSGLIEGDQIDWYSDPEKAAYLKAPFSVYPAANQVIPIPSTIETPEARTYIESILHHDQKKILRFVLICMHNKHEVRPGLWRAADEHLTEYFESLGFTPQALEEKNPVRVIQFECTKMGLC